MDRSEFLKTLWTPYPPMPEDCSTFGRIISIERSAHSEFELELILERAGQSFTAKFAKAPLHSLYLQNGDIIAIQPNEEILLLAPQLSPLPVKKFAHQIQKQWGQYLASVRDFFAQAGFQEVKTPSLVTCPGTEPSLDVFSTDFKIGSRTRKLYLPTSPELHLKKLLAAGADKVFEVANCYRNGEITTKHQPEFLMLEWYRTYENLTAIKSDVENLVHFLAQKLQRPSPQKVRSYSVSELFSQYCDFNLTPQTTLQDLRELAHRLKVDVHSAESIDDYFFLIFMDKIESQLPADELIFVEKYPPYQAALARLTVDGWGDRFEAYWQGMELANAFNELNDPQIQRLRAQEDLDKKIAMDKEALYLDEEFMLSLEAGMPPSAGIALGLERLFMAFYGLKEISEVRQFSIK